MNVRLETFQHSFSVTGTEGGLDCCSVKFVSARPAKEDADAATAAMQDVADRYVGILDRLFAEGVLQGERQPVINDGYGSVEVGYAYKGSFRRAPLLGRAPDSAARLSEVFGIPDPDMRGGSGRQHVSHSASVTFSTGTRRGATHDPGVAISWTFNHRLNTCLFRFTQSLDGVEVSDKATGDMAALDRNLALDWDKAGQDWYKAFLGSGAVTSPGQEGSP